MLAATKRALHVAAAAAVLAGCAGPVETPGCDAAAACIDVARTGDSGRPDGARPVDGSGGTDASSPRPEGGAGDGAGDGAPPAGSGGTGGAPGDSAGPCPDCRVHVPPGYAGAPAPLLVALHGDEGRDIGLSAATSGVVDAWRAAADAHGFIVLALACPAAEGCDGAWSDWLAAQGYRLSDATLAWAARQVDAVERAYNVDRAREYLAGYSGGGYWLGYYAPAAASRFAGVAFVAGGMPAYQSFNGCPGCRIPGYFLAGNMDPRTRQVSDTANAFEGCGSTVVRDLFTGDHEQTIASLTSAGRADTILTWFGAHPLACP